MKEAQSFLQTIPSPSTPRCSSSGWGQKLISTFPEVWIHPRIHPRSTPESGLKSTSIQLGLLFCTSIQTVPEIVPRGKTRNRCYFSPLNRPAAAIPPNAPVRNKLLGWYLPRPIISGQARHPGGITEHGMWDACIAWNALQFSARALDRTITERRLYLLALARNRLDQSSGATAVRALVALSHTLTL